MHIHTQIHQYAVYSGWQVSSFSCSGLKYSTSTNHFCETTFSTLAASVYIFTMQTSIPVIFKKKKRCAQRISIPLYALGDGH